MRQMIYLETKATNLPRQQNDLRGGWVIFGRQIGRAIQEVARADEGCWEPQRAPASRDYAANRGSSAEIA